MKIEAQKIGERMAFEMPVEIPEEMVQTLKDKSLTKRIKNAAKDYDVAYHLEETFNEEGKNDHAIVVVGRQMPDARFNVLCECEKLANDTVKFLEFVEDLGPKPQFEEPNEEDIDPAIMLIAQHLACAHANHTRNGRPVGIIIEKL